MAAGEREQETRYIVCMCCGIAKWELSDLGSVMPL